MLATHRTNNFAAVCLALGLLTAAQHVAHADSGANAAAIDQQVQIVVGEEAVEIEYATQLNRPAAFAEVLKIDANRDGQLDAREQAAYFQGLAETLRRGLEVRVNGRPAKLQPLGDVQLEMPFRKTYRYRLPHPDRWRAGAAVELHNENYLNYTGQLKIALQPAGAVNVVYDSLAADDPGRGGVLLPDPAQQGQAHQRDIVFGYRAGSGRYQPRDQPELADRLLHAAGQESGQGDVELAPPSVDRRAVVAWIVTAFCFAGGLIAVGWRTSAVRPTGRIAAASTLLLAGCAGVCVAAGLPERNNDLPRLSRAEAAAEFQRLHRGVYHAFGQRSEDAVYDTLAEHLAGDALDGAYNEVYQAVLDDDGRDTRFSVRRVKPIETVILPPGRSIREPHYRVRYRWRVGGTVTHFNHTHARVNEYAATYTVSLREGAWRITDVRMRQHKRLSTESPPGRD